MSSRRYAKSPPGLERSQGPGRWRSQDGERGRLQGRSGDHQEEVRRCWRDRRSEVTGYPVASRRTTGVGIVPSPHFTILFFRLNPGKQWYHLLPPLHTNGYSARFTREADWSQRLAAVSQGRRNGTGLTYWRGTIQFKFLAKRRNWRLRGACPCGRIRVFSVLWCFNGNPGAISRHIPQSARGTIAPERLGVS